MILRSGKPLTQHPQPEKKNSATRPIDNSTEQAINQLTTNHSPKKEREHSLTHDKQDDVQRISSGNTTSTSASFDIRSPPYPG